MAIRKAKSKRATATRRKVKTTRARVREIIVIADDEPVVEQVAAQDEKTIVKELHLTRPIVFLDLETTGLSAKLNRIIEIACVKLHPSGDRELFTRRINPEQEIEPEAQAVHAICDADVASCPTFGQLAPAIHDFLQNCDLSGFNIEKFDIPFLKNSFARAGIDFPPSSGPSSSAPSSALLTPPSSQESASKPDEPVHLIDTLRIYHHHEPRDLSAAYQFYTGRALEKHHSAEADAQAAADILLAQVRRYSGMPSEVPALNDYLRTRERATRNRAWIDAEGKLVWRRQQAVLNFGKHKFRSLRDLLEKGERSYLSWMVTAEFPTDVVAIVNAALKGDFPVFPAVVIV